MQKIFFLISVIIISSLAGVHSLQCYACYNCTNPTDADLVTCGEPVTSAPPTPAPSVATTTSPGATTASSVGTTASSGGTTDSSGPTTDSGGTTDSSGPTSDSSGPTSDSSGGTTDSSVVTTDSTTSGAESTLNYGFEDPSPEGTRSKRSILSPLINSNSDGCNCRNEKNCECANDLFSYRNTQYADEVPYVCYKVIEQDGIIYRGCGPATWPDGTALCESEIAVNLTSCITCDTDKCNSSFTIQYSGLMLVAAMSILLLK